MLVDDAVLIREGIARLLRDEGVDVVAQRGDAIDLLDDVEGSRPDVVILDVRMPPTNTTEGLVAALELKCRIPEIGVLVLSQYVETHHAMELLMGAHSGVGYLLKERITAESDLVDAITRIHLGGTVIDPEVVRHGDHVHVGTATYGRRELDEARSIAGVTLKIDGAITVAGQRVGEVKEIILEGTRARVNLKIRRDVNLKVDAALAKRSESLLGDYLLDLVPGSAEAEAPWAGRASLPGPAVRVSPKVAGSCSSPVSCDWGWNRHRSKP